MEDGGGETGRLDMVGVCHEAAELSPMKEEGGGGCCEVGGGGGSFTRCILYCGGILG